MKRLPGILCALVLGAWCGPAWAAFTSITWKETSNVSVSGDDLTKTGGSAWDGDGVSTNEILGDGGARFTVQTASGTNLMICLTYTHNSTSFTDGEWCVFNNNTTFKAYENGSQVYAGAGGSVDDGDVLSVERVSGTVTYKLNGSTQYTSGIASPGPVMVKAALNTSGAVLQDGEIDGGSDPSPYGPITWTGVTDATASGADLVKTSATGWTSDGTSTATITGDGACEFIALATNTHRMLGLDESDGGPSFTDIHFAAFARSDGSLAAYENGINVWGDGVGEDTSYAAGDRVAVARTGTGVGVLHNGSLVYQFTTGSTGTVQCEGAVNTQNGQITSARIAQSSVTSELDTTAPVFQGAGGDPDIDVQTGSGDGEIDVAWTGADDPESSDPVEYRVCDDDDASGHSDFDQFDNCTAWTTEATWCSGNACAVTLTGFAENEQRDVTVQARDALDNRTAYNAGADYLAQDVPAGATPPAWQDTDSDIRILTADQPYFLKVVFDRAQDGLNEPSCYALTHNTTASDSGATRWPAVGCWQAQYQPDSDSDGIAEVVLYLPTDMEPLATRYVAAEACDALGSCTTPSLEGTDVASGTTLPDAYMVAGDVAATALTIRWTNGSGNPAVIYRKTNATSCSSSDFTALEQIADGTFSTQYTGLTADQDVCFVVTICDDGGCTGESADSRMVIARPTSKGAIIKSVEGLVMANPGALDLSQDYGPGADIMADGFYAPGENMAPFAGGVRIYATRTTSDTDSVDGRLYVAHNGGGDDYYRWLFTGVPGRADIYVVEDGSETQIGTQLVFTGGDWYVTYTLADGFTFSGGGTRSDTTLTGAVTRIKPMAVDDDAADDLKLFGPSPTITMNGLPSGAYMLRCDGSETLQQSALESGGVATMTLADSLGGWYNNGWLKVSTQNSDCTSGILGALRSFTITIGSVYTFKPAANPHALTGPALRDVQPTGLKVKVSAEQAYDFQIEIALEADGFPGILVRGPPLTQMGASNLPRYHSVAQLVAGLVPFAGYQYRSILNGEPGVTYTFPTHPADGTEGIQLCVAGSCLSPNHVPYLILAAMGTRVNQFRALNGSLAPVIKVPCNGDCIYENPRIVPVACWADKTNPACPADIDAAYWDAFGSPNTREAMHGGGPSWTVLDDHDGCRNDCTGANHHAWVNATTGESDGNNEYTLNAVEIAAFDASRDVFHRDGNPDPFDSAEPGFVADIVGRVLYLITDLISYRDDLNATNQLVTETTGTVSINAGSAALTGSGTTFTNMDVGDPIRIGGTGECIYQLATITDGTNATVTPAYGFCGEANASGAAFTAWRQYDAPNSGSKTMLGARQLSAFTRAIATLQDSGTVDRFVWLTSKSLWLGQDHAGDSWESDKAGKPGYTAERSLICAWAAARGIQFEALTGDNHNRGFDVQPCAREWLTVGPGPQTYNCNQDDPPTHGFGCRSPDFVALEIDTDPGGVCDKGLLTDGVCVKPEAVGVGGQGLLVNRFIAAHGSDTDQYAAPQRSQRIGVLSGGALVGRRGEDSVSVSDATGVFDRFDPVVNVGENPGSNGLTSGVGSNGADIVVAGRFTSSGTFESVARRYTVSGQTLTFASDTQLSTSGWTTVLSPTMASDNVTWSVREVYFAGTGNYAQQVFRNGTLITIDDGEAARKYSALAAVDDWIAFAFLHDGTGEYYFRYAGPGASAEGSNPNDETTGQFAAGGTGVANAPAVCSGGASLGAIMLYRNTSDALGVVLMDDTQTRGSAFTVESGIVPHYVTCTYMADDGRWYAAFERGGTIYVWRAADPETNDWELFATIDTEIGGVVNCGFTCIVDSPSDHPVSGTLLPILVNFRPDHGLVEPYWESVVVQLDVAQQGGDLTILELLGVL